MSDAKRMLTLQNRELLRIEGVREIVSFDEQGAQLSCIDGDVCVEGEGIKIVELDRECSSVEIVGRIDCIAYLVGKEEKRATFFGRLFG